MSQYEHGPGYVPSSKDLRDYRVNRKVAMAIALPDRFEVPHGTIKNQKSVGSCVAYSTVSVLEAAYEKYHGDVEYFSNAWIYGYRPIGYHQGIGMMPKDALKTITKVGYLEFHDLPGNYEMPEAKQIVDEKLDYYKGLASVRHAASYARLYSYKEIKQAIYLTGLPVIMSIPTSGKGGIELDENYIAMVLDGNRQSSSHMVCCYGWNESGLLIQNSWGLDFGNKGVFILPEEYGFGEAWAISFDNKTSSGDQIVVKPGLYRLKEVIMKVFAIIKGLFN